MANRADDNPLEGAEAAVGEISVDRDAEVPIGVQLAWALRSRIGAGRLAPGMRLPGLRELAETTGVNVNTVRAVYQRLEHEGLIDTQHGSGTYVSQTPPQPSAASNIAAHAASQARETGVDPRAVAAALYVSHEPAAPDAGQDQARERRRLLREQIATLERTLGELESVHPGLLTAVTAAKGRRAGSGPSLLDTVQLEGVLAALVQRLADIQAALDTDANEAGRAKAPKSAPSPVIREPANRTKRGPAKRRAGRPAAAGT